MFGLFKRSKKKETEKVPTKSTSASPVRSREQQLLRDATQAYREENDLEKALELIDKSIRIYEGRGEFGNAILEGYKKKGPYLFKNNRGDEAWAMYNKLIARAAQEDPFMLPQIYEEMRKQSEFEKRFDSALRYAFIARMLKDKNFVSLNLEMKQESSRGVDIEFEEDKTFQRLCKKLNIDWEPIRAFLINEYTPFKKNLNFLRIADEAYKIAQEELSKSDF